MTNFEDIFANATYTTTNTTSTASAPTIDEMLDAMKKLPPPPPLPSFIVRDEVLKQAVDAIDPCVKYKELTYGTLYGVRMARVADYWISEGHPLYRTVIDWDKYPSLSADLASYICRELR